VSDSDNKLTRRELLRSVGRYAALAGIGVLAAKLMLRRSGGADGDIASQTCVNSGICSGCGAFDDCRLPQALSARRAKAK
jgi:hypothetical protein